MAIKRLNDKVEARKKELNAISKGMRLNMDEGPREMEIRRLDEECTNTLWSLGEEAYKEYDAIKINIPKSDIKFAIHIQASKEIWFPDKRMSDNFVKLSYGLIGGALDVLEENFDLDPLSLVNLVAYAKDLGYLKVNRTWVQGGKRTDKNEVDVQTGLEAIREGECDPILTDDDDEELLQIRKSVRDAERDELYASSRKNERRGKAVEVDTEFEFVNDTDHVQENLGDDHDENGSEGTGDDSEVNSEYYDSDKVG
ncbi:hypothetical protein POM88_028222 [Heracleum sosnowskyi]|uniref:Uncharacterized protein n=1 Tax=Heracleum sosnowskyi TaxID=360622 RepID=A0AAD8IBP7_9APIA|nr:hypothetical protein POM88_028222 [Heracleum sosnowskyi]